MLHERGAVLITNLNWKKFCEAALIIDSSLKERIEKDEFREEYWEYLQRMEELSEK